MKTVDRITSSARIRLRFSGLAFCPRCNKAVELLSFNEAAKSFNTDIQDIELQAKHGYLHRLHNWRAKVMICGLSLSEFIERRQPRLLNSHFIYELLT